eukprot:NODE_1194_length_1047_cov_213.666333_g916_i0.p1 GENE.NODE_1194_length_1047_cov_213.666333_g916_i0~~NODE_1194_length_1047_cov_213.666333_g916_i0.p1  ORF type:complete len:286 (+),score=35.94 NODE_1194_length_1047_cov_213.666333_g916_i0:58-915(+)
MAEVQKPIKVYLNFEACENQPEFKLKITLPAKWVDGPIQKVLDLFVKHYNQKFAEHLLASESLGLKTSKGVLPLDGKVGEHIAEYSDIEIITRKKSTEQDKPAGPPPGSLQCKNFGCQKWFMEAENGDTACRHHSGAPVFHDLQKYWTCCSKKKAWDWDEFQAIEGCVEGPHSTVAKEVFKPAPAVETPAPLPQQAVAASEEPQKPIVRPDVPGPIVDGKAKCRNQGCGVEFVVAENTGNVCSYHSGAPVFHDANKYWSCCPTKKCWDWEEFLAVPHCCSGTHKV